MRNKYPGKCYYCGQMVAKGEGHFEKNNGKKKGGPKWLLIHARTCTFDQRREKELLKKIKPVEVQGVF